MVGGVNLAIKLKGAGQLRTSLQKIKFKLLNDPRPHREAGMLMQERTERRISRGKNVRNRNLLPLAQSTLDRRQRDGIAGSRPLLARRNLFRSIEFKVRKGRATLTTIEPDARTERGLIKIHQEGRGVPVREVLGINTTDEREIRRIFSTFIRFTLDAEGRQIGG